MVVLLVGLALGSALTYRFGSQVTGASHSTRTLTVQYVYYYHGLLTCETVSGSVVTTYVNYGGTVGLTTMYDSRSASAAHVATITTTESAESVFYTQGSTPTC